MTRQVMTHMRIERVDRLDQAVAVLTDLLTLMYWRSAERGEYLDWSTLTVNVGEGDFPDNPEYRKWRIAMQSVSEDES